MLHSVRTHWPESIRFKYLIPTFLPDYNCCTVSGHMGPSVIGSNTWFRHFCLIRIVAQCPDTWARVQLIQIPEWNILASSELLFSVRTHWPNSNRFKYPIPTFLPDHNCCTVSRHMGPSPFSSNTQFRHFCHIIIVVQCPNAWARVQSVQIPDSDISARLSLLHSVRTHWPKSNQY